MLVDIEYIKLKKNFSNKKNLITEYIKENNLEASNTSYRFIIELLSRFVYIDLLLNKVSENLFLSVEDYYNLYTRIEKTIKYIDSLFSMNLEENKILGTYHLNTYQITEINSFISEFIDFLETILKQNLKNEKENRQEMSSLALKKLMARLEELCSIKISENLSINQENFENIYDQTSRKSLEILAKLQQETSDLQASTKQNIMQQIESIKDNLETSKMDLKELVGDLESYKRLINHKSEEEISKHYAKKSSSEKWTYWITTILSISIICVSIFLAWTGLENYYKTYVVETSLAKLQALKETAEYAKIYLGFRLILSGLLFSTVIYTSRIAYRAYIHWRHSESMKLKLSSLRPFINQLEPSDRKQIHKDLVPEYFGKNAGMVDGVAEKFKDLPANVSAVAIKAIEQIGGSKEKKEEENKNNQNGEPNK